MKWISIFSFALVWNLALAAAPQPKEAKPVVKSTEKRQTSLSFEDDVVENLSNPLLDSLDSTRNKNSNLDGVLYLKRQEYRKEIKQNLRELRYLQ